MAILGKNVYLAAQKTNQKEQNSIKIGKT